MLINSSGKVLAFYYSWYGVPKDGHGWHMWNYHEAGVEHPELSAQAIQLPHYPRSGFYNSNNDEVISTHLALANEAGLDGLIVSWWGLDSRFNRSFPRILDLATGHMVKLTIYYESSLVPGSVYFLVEDLYRLLAEYGAHESFMKINGMPVVFIYERAIRQYSWTKWQRAIELLKKRANVLLGRPGEK